jgi:hypothetical protein
MIILVTNIWRTKVTIRKTTIEKTIFGADRKMLDK